MMKVKKVFGIVDPAEVQHQFFGCGKCKAWQRKQYPVVAKEAGYIKKKDIMKLNPGSSGWEWGNKDSISLEKDSC